MTETALSMPAIAIAAPGGPEVLTPVELPVPAPGPGEVLIRVAAAGVNRPDALQRQGHYPPPPGASPLPGLEVSGTVAAIGPGAGRWRAGDRVMALLPGGGYAGYAAVPAGHCLPWPETLSAVEAACLPEGLFTVWHNLFERGRLIAGESVLIQGGLSGIGTLAIAMARLRGATVYATAGGPERARRCEALGAARGIDYRAEDQAEAIKSATGGRGVDVVLDMAGGRTLTANLACLADDGRHVSIAFLAGARAEIDIRLVMQRRLTLTGSTLRPRPAAEKARMAGAIERAFWPEIAAGRLKPVIDSVFPLARAADAHRRLDGGGHVGKIALTLDGGNEAA